MKPAPASNEAPAGARRNRKALALAALVGVVTFVYLFFSNPFIPRIRVCDFAQPAVEPGPFLQYDTGYGFNPLQTKSAIPNMPPPMARTYHTPIENLEFDRIKGGVIFFNIDDSGDLYPIHADSFKVRPFNYAASVLIFKLCRNAVKSFTVTSAGKKDVFPLDQYRDLETYLVIHADTQGTIHLGLSSRMTVLYQYRYLPLNLREVRLPPSVGATQPLLLVTSGKDCKAIKGVRRGQWDYFPVNLAPFGEASVYYTLACLAAALLLAWLVYLCRDPRGFYHLISFTSPDRDQAGRAFPVLYALTACCYLLLLYVFYPGTSAWDFPYQQATSLALSHWLSVYHSLFYIVMHVTFGFFGIFLVQILMTSYLLALSAATWINAGLHRVYVTVLVLLIGLSPPVAAFSIYFKRDILGGLFCATAVVLAFIAFRSNRRALAWSYVFAVMAVATRIDYIFYLLALTALDIAFAARRLRAVGRAVAILVLAVVVLHSIIPGLVIEPSESEEAKYKIVALATFLHYAYTKHVMPEEDKKVFESFYRTDTAKFHPQREMRKEVTDYKPFRNLWVRTAVNNPGTFFQFCYKQFRAALKHGFFEARPSHQFRTLISYDFGLIQPREGTYTFRLLKSLLSYAYLWSLVPSLLLLTISLFFFKRSPLTSLFALACLIRFMILLPLAPGFRFFYAYDIYLIGLTTLGLLPAEWKKTAPPAPAQA